jgi:hypothetical protein
MAKVTNWRDDPKMQALKALCSEQGYRGIVAVGIHRSGIVEVFSYGIDGPWCDAMGTVGKSIDDNIQSGMVETVALEGLLS